MSRARNNTPGVRILPGHKIPRMAIISEINISPAAMDRMILLDTYVTRLRIIDASVNTKTIVRMITTIL